MSESDIAEPTTLEAYPEAAAILREAGWKPHDEWGVYTRDTLIMGFSPDGRYFDVKNWAAMPDSPDTPDDPVEAARWLVRLREPPAENPLSLAALAPVYVAGEDGLPVLVSEDGSPTVADVVDEWERMQAPPAVDENVIVSRDADDSLGSDILAAEAEEGQTQAHAGNGETGGGSDVDLSWSGGNENADPGWDNVDAESGGHTAAGGDRIAETFSVDADFTEFGGALETEALADLPELEPPTEEVDDCDSAETTTQYVFGDNLANDRLFRQGQVSDKAEKLIEEIKAVVDEGDSEFPDLQAYVVSSLNEAGIFIGTDNDKYRRFVELSEARRQMAGIQDARSSKIAFIRVADRQAVATFDPEADWPVF